MGGCTLALLKCAYLLNDSDCVQMWQTFSTAITRCLLDSTATGYWYGQADMQSGKRTNTITDASDALFYGAQALSRDFDRADRAMQSAFSLWDKFGIPPKQYDFAAGTVTDPGYLLSPEIAEAVYSLYRMTGNPVYLHMGRAFLDSTITYCKTDEGYAALESVITKKKADLLDPWFFSGTMKFIYLLFATPDVLDFSSTVMNSQGHPIRKTW
jgi:mannosidase alpha-like ER degradation enhancer 2